MSYAASSRSSMASRDMVVPLADWPSKAHEAPLPSTSDGVLTHPSSRVLHTSKTARKPLRSSPLAGPALLNNRSLVSLNNSEDGTQTPRGPPSPAIEPDFEQCPAPPLSAHLRSKCRARPSSIVSVDPPSPSPSPTPSVHRYSPRPSTAPGTIQSVKRRTSRPLLDIRDVTRPPSAVYSPIDNISAGPDLIVHWQQQGSPTVDVNVKSNGSDPHLRHSCASTGGASTPSGRRVSVVIEAETEVDEDGVDEDGSSMAVGANTRPAGGHADNSWYIANSYDVTPKFTRLGLSASNVVMPMSAKERKKQLSRAQSISVSVNPASANSRADKRASMSALTLSRAKRTSTTASLFSESDRLSVPPTSRRSGRAQNPLSIHRSPASAQSPNLRPSLTRSNTSSAASSVSSLPLTSAPESGSSSSQASSLVSSLCTSVNESEETATQHHDERAPPFMLSSGINKRQSMLARVKSWRRPSIADRDDKNEQGMEKAPRALGDGAYPSSVHDLRASMSDGETRAGTEIKLSRDREKKRVESVHLEQASSDESGTKESGRGGEDVAELPRARSESAILAPNHKVKRGSSVRRLWKVLVGGTNGGARTLKV